MVGLWSKALSASVTSTSCSTQCARHFVYFINNSSFHRSCIVTLPLTTNTSIATALLLWLTHGFQKNQKGHVRVAPRQKKTGLTVRGDVLFQRPRTNSTLVLYLPHLHETIPLQHLKIRLPCMQYSNSADSSRKFPGTGTPSICFLTSLAVIVRVPLIDHGRTPHL